METVILTIVIGTIAGALGLALGRYLWPATRSADEIALTTAQAEARHLSDAAAGLKERVGALESDLQQKSDSLQTEEKKSARLDERVGALTRQVDEQAQTIAAATSAQTSAASRAQAAGEQVARLTEREQALTNEVAELHNRDGKLQETLKIEFENIATKVLKANATELSDTSQKQIAAILDPLRERIQEFQGKVETTYDAEKREVLSLKEHIGLMAAASQNLGLQADGLAKALKGDVQMLGRWGELVLDRILRSAGLEEGREYISQGRGLGLKSEDGGAQKPDVIIRLPENRAMIVDSKVSLASYDRLITSKEESERREYAKQFVRDVKIHIDGLSGKRYQDNEQMIAHDYVLMFVPIEGALAAVLTEEPELFTYAWDRRVVLVGPPTLLMTLRTVSSIWRHEKQAQNAHEIAKLAGMLCDKVSDSLTDLNTVAERMHQAVEAHRGAVKRLSTGKGNALSIGLRIRNLGAKTKSPMPDMIVDGEIVDGERVDEDIEAEEETAVPAPVTSATN
jgi:DNA recombination protein RmuC